jgi:hypothetical protein
MQKTPYIGQMDRKVSILKTVKVQTTTGSTKPVEQLVIKCAAMLAEKGGDEQLEGKIINVVNREYTIRFNSDILAKGKDYILQDALIKYRILHVAELGRRRFLTLKVTVNE